MPRVGVANAGGGPDFTILKTGLGSNLEGCLTTDVDDGRYAFYWKIVLAPRLVTFDTIGRVMVASGDERLNHVIASWTGCDCAKRLGVPTTVQAA